MNFGNKIGKILLTDHPNGEVVFRVVHPWKDEQYDTFSIAENRFERLKLELGEEDKIELIITLMENERIISEEVIMYHQPYQYD